MIKYHAYKDYYVLDEKISVQTDIKISKVIRNKHSSMSRAGRITLFPGFIWDGATGAIDTPDVMEASAFHDFCCNEYNNGNLTKEQRKQADQMFKGLLKKQSVWSLRVKWMYQAVRKFFETKEWFKRVF
jgi:hypothetical protein